MTGRDRRERRSLVSDGGPGAHPRPADRSRPAASDGGGVDGFFLALEFVEDRASKTPATALTKRVVNELRNRGLLTGSIGPHANILKLRCPMVFSRENADFALERIDASLTAVSA